MAKSAKKAAEQLEEDLQNFDLYGFHAVYSQIGYLY